MEKMNGIFYLQNATALFWPRTIHIGTKVILSPASIQFSSDIQYTWGWAQVVRAEIQDSRVNIKVYIRFKNIWRTHLLIHGMLSFFLYIYCVGHIKTHEFLLFVYRGEDIKSLFLCSSSGISWREDMLPVCLQLCRADYVSGNKGKDTHNNTEH